MNVEWAKNEDARYVADVLAEAAEWLRATNRPIWNADDVSTEAVMPDIEQGRYLLVRQAGEPIAVVRFQLSDKIFWPELKQDDSAFIHRLAVRRKFAGTGVSNKLIEYSAVYAFNLGKKYLRLDCVRDRHSLRKFYESNGFRYHSDFQLGAWEMARYEMLLEPEIISQMDNDTDSRC
jgi:GNAT superfamily N-acetyltransferase